MCTPYRVKICGVRTPEAVQVAAEAGADAIGLVFAPRSPRYVAPDDARDLAAAAPPFVEVVGLFTDTPREAIHAIAADVPLTLLQLHGDDYGPAAIAALAPRRVVRALPFQPETAAATIEEWERHYRELPNLVGLLIDTPDPTRIGGGTGRAFDWDALRAIVDQVRPTVPLILAGGLVPENVAEAIRIVRPWAVDVSSGVEVARGVKDLERIRAFCQTAKGGACDV